MGKKKEREKKKKSIERRAKSLSSRCPLPISMISGKLFSLSNFFSSSVIGENPALLTQKMSGSNDAGCARDANLSPMQRGRVTFVLGFDWVSGPYTDSSSVISGLAMFCFDFMIFEILLLVSYSFTYIMSIGKISIFIFFQNTSISQHM